LIGVSEIEGQIVAGHAACRPGDSGLCKRAVGAGMRATYYLCPGTRPAALRGC
jgi:hypothetical protein